MDSSQTITAGQAIVRLVIAIMGGALIGLERERARTTDAARKKRQDIPGVRSFGLISLYGGLVGLSSSGLIQASESSGVLVSLAFAGFLILYAAYTAARYFINRVQGITTSVVILISFIIGYLAGLGYLIEAAGVSVIVTLLLALKEPLERAIPAITYREFIALLEVALLALVVAPIVRAYSRPVLGIDPYKVYVFFIIILALSFASYAAARIMGVRGLVYSAILGSLVNSEATINGVTRVIASAEESQRRVLLAQLSTILILGVMQARALVIVLIAIYIFVGPEPVIAYSPVFIALELISLAAAWASFKRMPYAKSTLIAASPLSWGAAFRAAFSYLVLTLAVSVISKAGLAGATPIIIALGGLVNATAAILSVASLAETLGYKIAVASMLASIAAATISKPLYADPSVGQRALARITLICLGFTVPYLIASLIIYGAS